MKTSGWFTAAAVAAVGIWAMAGNRPAAMAQSHDGHGHEGGGGHDAQAEPVSLDGEVVDLHCFMLHPDTGHGAEHAKCAQTCMNKGLPIGFLSGDKVYLLLGKGHDSARGIVAEHAGQPVRLTGVPIEHNGMRAIQVERIEAAGGDSGHGGH